MTATMIAAIYIVTVTMLCAVIIVVDVRGVYERKDLYDRLMSCDISQYKAYTDDGKDKAAPPESAHQKAIERFEHFGN